MVKWKKDEKAEDRGESVMGKLSSEELAELEREGAAGDGEAYHILGEYYSDKGDDDKAERYFLSANENGCADALPALGVLYLRSDDEKKKEKGFGYVRFAAEHGDDTCLHLLGFCYMSGTGVARDEEKAVEAWENAVERGVVNAMVDLGK